MTTPTQRTFTASAHATCEAKYAVVTTARRHVIPADEAAERGGGDSGPNPLELLATALASCTAITLRMYAERKGWELGTVKVDCRVVEEGTAVRFERSIRIGAPLEDTQRARLGEIAEKTPVTKVVKAGAPIATELR
jgi:putative redox protein